MKAKRIIMLKIINLKLPKWVLIIYQNNLFQEMKGQYQLIIKLLKK
jgi:hypothetical protein